MVHGLTGKCDGNQRKSRRLFGGKHSPNAEKQLLISSRGSTVHMPLVPPCITSIQL